MLAIGNRWLSWPGSSTRRWIGGSGPNGADSWSVASPPRAGEVPAVLFLDVLRVMVVVRLRGAGVGVATIRKVVTELAERYNVSDPLTLGRLVVAGNRLYWAIDDATLLDVLAQQTALAGVVILPVGEMAAETRERMEAVYCPEVAQEAAS